MSTLYELTAEYMQLLEMAEDPDIDLQTLADTMEALSGEIEDKADGYAKVIRSIETDIDGIIEEISRLQFRRQRMELNVRHMKDALQTAMLATGKTKIKTTLFSFNVQKNPPSVVMDEQYIENVPEEYLIYQEPKINKKAILEDIKAGRDLSGIAHLEQGESLRIR